ncbi:hypothetical protein COLO4_04492 [Corchorus olitorius]|uniref:DUF7769 domain-containing protein n=1 Tax=Corchorus olitorius TaxID=93759 RepID=A0A1R3KTN4_9ROSI|nr:hypothetical protein COLO4_04492 [Corchorus olitorius]
MEGSGGSSYYNPPAQDLNLNDKGTRVELSDLNIAVEEGFHTQIPDLNIGVEEGLHNQFLDLNNVDPTSNRTELSSATPLICDLNIEPVTEDDTNIEGQTSMLPSNNSTQIPPENSSNMEEADNISLEGETTILPSNNSTKMPHEHGSNVEESNFNMEEDDFDMEDADFDAEEAYFHMEAYFNFVKAGFEMEGAYFDMEEAGFDMEEANYDIEETNFNMETAKVQGSSHKRHYNMSNEECMAIYRICLENSIYGILEDDTKKMLASSFGVCTKSIQRLWKRAKPYCVLRVPSGLKPENKIARLRFCLSMLETVVARPRFDAASNELFSGKIGVFPLVIKEPSKRSSVNRPAGTLETKPITTVNKDIMKTFLIDKVLPAIREKWPHDDMRSPIYIQQDNARPHVKCDDDDFKKAQAATPKTIDDLIMAVENSFEEFSHVDSD